MIQLILIDYRDKRPIYEQIVERFQTLILNGALEPDEKMPSVRSLAIELSINPNTIQRAYRELEQTGYIYSIKGRGNFVRMNDNLMENKKRKMLKELKATLETYRDMNISYTDVLECVREIYGEVNDDTN